LPAANASEAIVIEVAAIIANAGGRRFMLIPLLEGVLDGS
jgi:hypothetical protein